MPIDIFGTHFPILAACVSRTRDPVVEFGVGHYSTPMLHFMCDNRLLYSLDSDGAWIDQFNDLRGKWHQFVYVPSEEKTFDAEPHKRMVPQWKEAVASLPDVHWDVALVDCAPGEMRPDLALWLKPRCRWIVVHDVEELDKSTPCGSNYGWSRVLDSFKHVFIWKKYRPHTAVLSDEARFSP